MTTEQVEQRQPSPQRKGKRMRPSEMNRKVIRYLRKVQLKRCKNHSLMVDHTISVISEHNTECQIAMQRRKEAQKQTDAHQKEI